MYYAPDGEEVGRVENGTGTIKYCRSDGTSEVEYTLLSGQVVREKQWTPSNVLRSERTFSNRLLNGESGDYHEDGGLRERLEFNCCCLARTR